MDISLFTSIFSEDCSLTEERITLSSGVSLTLSELAALSTRELVHEFRRSKDADKKQILLDLIQQKNPISRIWAKLTKLKSPFNCCAVCLPPTLRTTNLYPCRVYWGKTLPYFRPFYPKELPRRFYQKISISKIAENVWINSANLVKGWADFKGPNAMWRRGNYIGQTAILDVIGGSTANGKQMAMDDGLGERIEQMLRDVRVAKIPLTINSGFHDFKKQEQLKRDQPDNAAIAGRSEHQAGRSVDFNNKTNAKVYEWLRHRAATYKKITCK